MADNDLKIWQNYLLPNPFHMVDEKFDLVLRPISHGNPAMSKNFIIYIKYLTYEKNVKMENYLPK